MRFVLLGYFPNFSCRDYTKKAFWILNKYLKNILPFLFKMVISSSNEYSIHIDVNHFLRILLKSLYKRQLSG